jgi:hypothetical protein
MGAPKIPKKKLKNFFEGLIAKNNSNNNNNNNNNNE